MILWYCPYYKWEHWLCDIFIDLLKVWWKVSTVVLRFKRMSDDASGAQLAGKKEGNLKILPSNGKNGSSMD